MVTANSRILGPDGQPIRTAELKTPQTRHLASLHQEWQGHPSRGLTPSRLARILEAAEQGDLIAQYELFEDMEERDGHILAEMGKRRRAVSGLPWDIVPPANATPAEKDAAKQLKQLMEEIDEVDSVIYDTTDAIGKGFCCQEIEWHRLDGLWLPRSIVHRPQSWFQLYRGHQQEIRLRDNSQDGEPLQPFGWIAHTHRARSGYLERANLFRALVWPYLFKNYAVGDLAEFLEIYGIPLRIGKYPSGSSERDKATLLRALVEVGHNAAGIMPEGMEVTLHKAADGDPAAFQLMMDWCERTESKVILGATLTSQADRGSNTNALGNVHDEVRKELRDSDAPQVARTLSRDLVYPIAALNGLAPGGWRRCPRLHLDTTEARDVHAYSDSLGKLAAIGVRIPRSWAQKELGIPEPDEGEEVLVGPTAPGPGFDDRALRAQATMMAEALRGTLRPQVAALNQAQPAPSAMREQLAGSVDPVASQWVERVRELASRVSSLEELRDRLIDLVPDMSLDDYARLLAEGTAAAHLAGRFEVDEESGDG